MTKKAFFDHLVDHDHIVSLLPKEYSMEEKSEITDLLDQHFHYNILNLVLSKIPPDKHDEFLLLIENNHSHDHIIIFINTHSKLDIEKEILSLLEKLIEEVRKDLQTKQNIIV